MFILKNCMPSSYEHLPYWEFQILVEDWIEHVKEENKKAKDDENKQRSTYKEPKQPNYKMPSMNFPKMT